jgi:hypothetical protein
MDNISQKKASHPNVSQITIQTSSTTIFLAQSPDSKNQPILPSRIRPSKAF